MDDSSGVGRGSKGMTKREVTGTRSSPPATIGRTSPLGQSSNQSGPLNPNSNRSGRRSSSPRLSPCPTSPSPRTSPLSTSPRPSIATSPLSPRPGSPVPLGQTDQECSVVPIMSKPRRSPPVVPPRTNSTGSKKLCHQSSIRTHALSSNHNSISGDQQSTHASSDRFLTFQSMSQTNPFLSSEGDDGVHSFHSLGSKDESKESKDHHHDKKKKDKDTVPKCTINASDLGAEGDDEYDEGETGELFDFEEEPELTEIANNILRQLKERERTRNAFTDMDANSLDEMECSGENTATGECSGENTARGKTYQESLQEEEDEVDRKRRREVITVQSVLKDAENMDDLTDHESDDESLPATYENKTALGDDLLFLASMPELCGERALLPFSLLPFSLLLVLLACVVFGLNFFSWTVFVPSFALLFIIFCSLFFLLYPLFFSPHSRLSGDEKGSLLVFLTGPLITW